MNTTTEQKEEMINRLRANMKKVHEHYADAPTRFLDAWKEAVHKIGAEYFQTQRGYTIPMEASVATDKWQLIPNIEAMASRFASCSIGEGVFMAAVLSFYNSEISEPFMTEFGMCGIGDISGRLDLDEIEIITRLMLNHTGW